MRAINDTARIQSYEFIFFYRVYFNQKKKRSLNENKK